MADGSLSVVDEFDDGFGWVAAPEESLLRTSHALRTTDGFWLLDPLDAPGLDDELADRSAGAGAADAAGAVAGVAVCAGWHARDAAALAARYDVPVTVPSWMDRPLDHFDASADAPGVGEGVDVQRVDDHLPGTDVSLHRVSPMGAWREAVCWRERDRTLYVPESLGTADAFLVGDERLGVVFYARLFPPRNALSGFAPDRVLVGHGTGVFEDAAGTLADALDGSRRRFPRALVANGPGALRNLVAAARR
ncbi:hypothetical protein G9C85_07910 [Halorubellus sp. JP-L1]|uniref:hypothetical protein n=1 Tax=Halorubellus sp. JP-L1 TaxID=2715753 RepID=UPI00140978E0|nr:hypothetical protein [Halorubellus sp. JP-L1]NHN41562.1 hypothetical protein [Halorubellus sp. JP-L1]